jgi:hypothetical protein
VTDPDPSTSAASTAPSTAPDAGRAVIVLGMHRSGTSATSRVLNRMGSWLGSETSVTRRFEHAAVQDTNEEILRSFGGRWHTPPQLDDGWTADTRLQALDAPARAALADLQGHPVFSWKDPRTCFTLPWWERHLHAQPVVVYVYRHPAEVAASLGTRNDFGPAHALMMWETYNVSALRAAAGHRVITMPYSQLVDAPADTAAVLHEALTAWGLPLTAGPESAVEEVTAERRHHEAAPELDPAVATPSQIRLWSRMQDLPRVADAFVPPTIEPMHAATRELLDGRRFELRQQDELAARHQLIRSRRALVRLLLHPAEARKPRPV